jgi:hypothetical protein
MHPDVRSDVVVLSKMSVAAAVVAAAASAVDVGAVAGFELVDIGVVLVATVAAPPARDGANGITRTSVVGRAAGATRGAPSLPHPIRAVVSASETLSSRRIFSS